MTYPYRLEPIVDLLSGTIIGHELLAGKDKCPVWGITEWRNWYVFLENEVPLLLSRISVYFFTLKSLNGDMGLWVLN